MNEKTEYEFVTDYLIEGGSVESPTEQDMKTLISECWDEEEFYSLTEEEQQERVDELLGGLKAIGRATMKAGANFAKKKAGQAKDAAVGAVKGAAGAVKGKIDRTADKAAGAAGKLVRKVSTPLRKVAAPIVKTGKKVVGAVRKEMAADLSKSRPAPGRKADPKRLKQHGEIAAGKERVGKVGGFLKKHFPTVGKGLKAATSDHTVYDRIGNLLGESGAKKKEPKKKESKGRPSKVFRGGNWDGEQ